MIEALKHLNISFEAEKTFPTCRDQGLLFFDFYVKYKNVGKLIEYQGIQHYRPTFGSDPIKVYNGIKKRDRIKRNWCQDNIIELLEIPYWKIDQIHEMIAEFINE